MTDPLLVIDDKRVWCIDQATGEVVWMKSVGGLTKGGKIEAALLNGGRVIVCTEFQLYCFEAQTGTEQWSRELEGMAANKAMMTLGQPLINRT